MAAFLHACTHVFLSDTHGAGQGCPHSGTNNTTYSHSGTNNTNYEGPQGPVEAYVFIWPCDCMYA